MIQVQAVGFAIYEKMQNKQLRTYWQLAIMSNSKRQCRNCKERFRPSDGIITANNIALCSLECLSLLAIEKGIQSRPKLVKDAEKAIKASIKVRKKALITRSQWLSKLQILINQHIVHVRDKDKPCFTCGTTSQSIKYDCGHYIHAGRGGADRRRFIDINLHKQCSVNCNQHGGGMPEVYAQRIIECYGTDKLGWLKCEANHPTLKELFPHWSDIENEIIRYRKLLRDNGLKPHI